MAERDWIRRFFAPLASAPGAHRLMNDTARLSQPSGTALIATTDAMVEGVHFFADDPIDTVARKLVRVNVSDVFAAGAAPHEALLTLGWSKSRPEAELSSFASALGDELQRWRCALIGGDTVVHPGALFVSLAMTGRCLGRAPLARAGARAGDDVWVTGEIGAGCRGYWWKTRGCGDARWLGDLQVPALPQLAMAGVIARHAHAAIDVSDGLIGDAALLAAASDVAIELDLDKIPFAGVPVDRDEALALASFGDDYQLLFTAAAEDAPAVLAGAERIGQRVTRIGRIRAGTELVLRVAGEPVNLPETLAFEHGRIGKPDTRP